MDDRKRVELRIKFHERSEKTATKSQTLCGKCKKPIINGICGCHKVVIKPGRTGI